MPPPASKTTKRRVLKVQSRQRKPAHEVRRHCLRVLVNDEEKADLQAQARTAKRSVGRYLREVGRGYQLKSTVDMEAVQKMARINGDMGRLGGLLKLYLKCDPRTAAFNADTVEALLQRIAAQQEELGRVMQAVVRPAAQSKF
ncbi:conjugal transfer transcriptional regulator TraJ [Azohydromonas sp. G-1-1-14]|uniref:Conjugal transfer transcriptional regulator TraJ n=1 Tax=Azohydromonas caseinilytica TaxID=2728836 RepID=A0A848FF97_9BURK|nr:conjugal transfer transcriptional regulator TraJ [Azohydromonas caseinilytica]